jgi:hypothetical protein
MAEVVLSTEDLVVLGGPDTINVEVDFGPQGDRGSLIFVGNGKPNVVDIGQDPNIFDLYVNLLTTDDEYLMLYQYVDVLGTLQWQTLTKLIPNTYVTNKSIDFTTQNYCYIPISDIVDPSYIGSTDASNFSVQVTFATSAGYPIVSSIKTEKIEANLVDPERLKITFYAKEFDGTNWSDISGSRTANLHISVV